MKKKLSIQIEFKGGISMSDGNKTFWGNVFKALITFASAIVGAWLGTGM